MTTDSRVIDRRTTDRAVVAVSLRVRRPGRDPLLGETLNLSVSGALIQLDRQLSLGSEVALELTIPDQQQPLTLIAIVVRGDGDDNQAPFRYGVHFMMPAEPAIKQIRALIYR